MVLDIAKYKPNRIVFHDFDVCVVFFYYFIVHLTIFGWNLTKTKTIFIQKLLRLRLSKFFFVLFWTEKFPTKKKAGLHKR